MTIHSCVFIAFVCLLLGNLALVNALRSALSPGSSKVFTDRKKKISTAGYYDDYYSIYSYYYSFYDDYWLNYASGSYYSPSSLPSPSVITNDVFASYRSLSNSILESTYLECPNCNPMYQLPYTTMGTSYSLVSDQPYDPLGGLTSTVGNTASDLWNGITSISNSIVSVEQTLITPVTSSIDQVINSLFPPEVAAFGTAISDAVVPALITAAVCTDLCALGVTVAGAVNTYNQNSQNGPVNGVLAVGENLVAGFGLSSFTSLFGFRDLSTTGSRSASGTTINGVILSYNITGNLQLFSTISGGKINTTNALTEHFSNVISDPAYIPNALQSAAKRMTSIGYYNADGRVVISQNPLLLYIAANASISLFSSGVKNVFKAVTASVPTLRQNTVLSQFQSQMDPKMTGGASGYFQMTLTHSGRGYYQWAFDLSDFKFPSHCDHTVVSKYGLRYDLYYVNSTSTSVHNTSSTGCAHCEGRYDPYLACSSQSEYASSSCKSLGSSINYNCTASAFMGDGNIRNCEVGDFSGKFGLMLPSLVGQSDNVKFTFYGSVLDDPNPPLSINYKQPDSRTHGWSHLVLSCPIVPVGMKETPILLSAAFEPIASNSSSSVVDALPSSYVTSYRGYFNGTILEEASEGAQGSFAIKINDEGGGSYHWDINMNEYKFTSLCPFDEIMNLGLVYRVHTSWDSKDFNASGGTYDPFYTCQEDSQYYNSTCKKLKRAISSNSFITGVVNGPPGANSSAALYCELGDFSCKFGNIKVTNYSSGIPHFIGHISDDPRSLLVSDFEKPDGWSSILFSCPINPSIPLFSIRLEKFDISPQSSSRQSTFAPTTSSASKPSVSSSSIAIAVVVPFVVILLLVVAYFCYKKKPYKSYIHVFAVTKDIECANQRPSNVEDDWN